MNMQIEKDTLTEQNCVTAHLRQIVQSYLGERPHLSVNALSRKFEISEPTLRRIYKGEVKTEPNTSTILDILSYMSGKTSIKEIASHYKGAVEKYLLKALPDAFHIELDYDPSLNTKLDSQLKYLIYKMASNSSGVSTSKVEEIFGLKGREELKELEYDGVVKETSVGVYQTNLKNFQTSQKDFKYNFKLVSDFIKAEQSPSARGLNPVRVNFSESVSEKTYQDILKVQRNAISKIQKLMSDPKAKGDIPVFMLVGIDTMDLKTADELIELNSK